MKELYTEQAAQIPDVPWEVYPRPQMRRERWLCLNGIWELRYGTAVQPVRVPFCPESLLSKVVRKPKIGEKLCYRRSFSVPGDWQGRRVLLHFGAVMRETVVRVNGQAVAAHGNGYLPFSADITDALRDGENDLSVSVINDLDRRYPYGKQSRKRGGMWYTPCSGIWQSVWLEPVPETYVRSLQITNGPDWVEIRAEGVQSGTVLLDGQAYELRNEAVRIKIADPHCWSPDDPYLYPFDLVCGEDRVQSYFALRTLSAETVNGIPRLCLNGKPFFFHGLLDQGYWSDGLYTPAAPALFEKDIAAMKALGFNTLRKHIKIEPEQFYYDCDRLGMIVFQDMVNNGEYRYIRDTVLPTLHVQKRRDHGLNRDPEARRVFLDSMDATVRQLRNHPCICLWTIFNEGWGQFRADDAYERLKALDPSRFVDSTSGWYHQKKSDVDSLHIYFDKLHLGKEQRPQLMSEFGGYVWKVPEHSYNLEKTYGYHTYETRDDYVQALRALFSALIPLAERGLCGAIYTQVSDVEDETNGFVTFDRAVCKLQPGELADVMTRLKQAVQA